MKKILFRLGKTLAFTATTMYIIITLFNQQVKLMDFRNSKEEYLKQIQEEKLKTEQLTKIRSEISSATYIEEVAREKLGLVMPYETVFMDASL